MKILKKELQDPPDFMTEPCYKFFLSHMEILGFFLFIPLLVDRIEETMAEADNEPMVRQHLKSYKKLILQMVLCRTIDNFLIYLAELIALVFRTKPITLMQYDEQYKMNEILQFENRDELIDYFAEKLVNELSSSRLEKLHEKIWNKHKFKLFNEKKDLKEFAVINEMRNIIVHNRGVVNHIVKNKRSDFPLDIGEEIEIDENKLDACAFFVPNYVTDIDRRASDKFKLPCPIPKEEITSILPPEL